MTEQAIKLGIPSLQLEIPREIRDELFTNPELFKAFADGIEKFYKKIVVPYYSEKTVELKISKELALNYEETITKAKDIDSIIL